MDASVDTLSGWAVTVTDVVPADSFSFAESLC